ncbi:tetratricopeptide repeat protein [Cohnella sp. CFH 77786]|uniref:ATP-binding protein n=1 Tax=Cohnella sp. CFH 77786 TaxID=2662265 RepID=UPI001C60853D|nr:tetratricopeptide repeat protein [Cohnella sp. CFH 77786]MBW5447667.1 tetratricopeptide repeat protein [Cohnella sp. CFH 77786]
MLGTFHCLYEDRPLPKMPTGKLQILFAYLLLHADTPINRKHLAFQFWPDSSEAQALTNLRKLLYDLKRLLPSSGDDLELRDGQVVWNANGACRVDVLEFEKQPLESLQVTELAEAAAMYRGELLPGVYDEWVVNRRETLSGRYATLLDQIIFLHEQKREFDSALPYAMRLIQLDRFSESAHLKLIRLFALSGEVTAALKRYEEMKALFEEELGVSPSEETQEIVRQLLDSRNTVEPPVAPKQKPRLIGRKQEWESLLKAWDRAVQERSLLVELEGEAGIGKTRLAEEFAYWAQSQGIRTLISRCYAPGGASAYEPVLAWLQKVSFDHLDPAELIEISRLMPEVKERHPGLEAPGPLHESWQLRNWYHANQKALFQDQPTLLVLEDLQWSDRETLQMIEYFLRTDHPHPLLILCTIRTEAGARDVSVRGLLHALRTRRQSVHIAVNPLQEAETGELIRLYSDRGALPLPVKHIHEESGGNPLFIHEIVRSGTGSIPEGYGSSLLTMMVQRLAELPSLCQKVINLMTVAGKPVSLSFLTGLADSVEQTLEQLELLQQLRILKRLENGELDFFHERMREAARLRMSESKKQLLHGLVARAMESSDNLRRYPAAEIAYHHEHAGNREEAAFRYEQAALEARQVFAHEMTIRYCLKVLSMAEPKSKLEILSCLAEAYRISGNWESAEKTYRTWLQLSELNEPLERKAMHQAALGNCLRLQGRYAEALLHFKQASQLFDTLEHREGLAEVYGYLGIVYQYTGEYDEAESCLKKRITLSSEDGEDGKFTGILGNVYFEQELYTEAMNVFKRQIRIANGNGDRHSLGQAFGGMALTYLEWEQFDWAFHSANEKLSISSSLGDRMNVANSIGIMGKIYMRAGYHPEARSCLLFCLQEALQIGDVRVMAIVLSLLGHTLDEQGNEESAWRVLVQAERIAAQFGIPYYLCDTLYYMGHHAVKRMRWDEAQRCIHQAMALAGKQRRQGLCCKLELLLLRTYSGKEEITMQKIAERLQQLLSQHPDRKEQAMIHLASWELCGSEESRVHATRLLEELYRNAPVPTYAKWEAVLRTKLQGVPRGAPPIPREAAQCETRMEQLLDAVARLT